MQIKGTTRSYENPARFGRCCSELTHDSSSVLASIQSGACAILLITRHWRRFHRRRRCCCRRRRRLTSSRYCLVCTETATTKHPRFIFFWHFFWFCIVRKMRAQDSHESCRVWPSGDDVKHTVCHTHTFVDTQRR